MSPSDREAWTRFVKQRETTVTRQHARFELLERAYLAALAGRDPETVPPAIWRAAIFAEVPDTSVEELIAMFNWRKRKAERRAGALEQRGRGR
jgi:hypothetical protein